MANVKASADALVTEVQRRVKEELLAELTHVPLALLGSITGWARWLEISLNEEDRRIPSWIWPVCFTLIGLLLLDYRES